jgi:metal-dependent amidase/aminoacylase/carboxypeptidase family protein
MDQPLCRGPVDARACGDLGQAQRPAGLVEGRENLHRAAGGADEKRVAPDLSEAYVAAAGDVVGPSGASISDQQATGSEDFAEMLKVVPEAYCRVGHAGWVPLHNPAFVLDDAILPVGASVYARIVETRLPRVQT